MAFLYVNLTKLVRGRLDEKRPQVRDGIGGEKGKASGIQQIIDDECSDLANLDQVSVRVSPAFEFHGGWVGASEGAAQRVACRSQTWINQEVRERVSGR